MSILGHIRLLPLMAATLFLTGAGYYLLGLEPGAPFNHAQSFCVEAVDPRTVEESFADELSLMKTGKGDDAVLALTPRTKKGPHRGAALFLLGEVAYGQKAYPSALDYYKQALEADRSLADKRAPFDARDRMLGRVEELRADEIAGRGTAGYKTANFLLRRLTGGCQ